MILVARLRCSAHRAPEQTGRTGGAVDQRTDLFSLGTVLYQLATGARPFQGDTSAVIFDAILNRDPAPMTQLNGSLPAELQRIVAADFGLITDQNEDTIVKRYLEATAQRQKATRGQRGYNKRRVDDFILYAMAAADEAIADAGWKPESYEDRVRTGVLIGLGCRALGTI